MKRSWTFQRGDRVVHPQRPEWGTGTVERAQDITHDGQAAQRLVVTFANHGRTTLNTAFASLQSEDTATDMTRSQTSTLTDPKGDSGGWLASIASQNRTTHELWALPDAMNDPFETNGSRLEATLDSYRFSTEPRSLIDWAVMQTGLKDPLSKYTRHELEQGFARFARDRDLHLLNLVRTLKRSGDQATLQRALNHTRNPAARNALQRAMRA